MRRRRLEEHLRSLPEVPQLRPRERAHVLAEHLDVAAVHLEEPERGARERGLSRSALADEPEHLAALDAEIDVVDRREAGATAEEPVAVVLHEPADLERWRVWAARITAGLR
jgi:hypothetical protein